MELISELLGSFKGQLSLAVVVFMIGMGVYIGRMAIKQIHKEEEDS
jgi:uncharacterized membrane protein